VPPFIRFVHQSGTALHETDQTFAFAVADWDRDGLPDLVAIKKSNTGTHSTEVHVLSGASGFQQFVVQTGTALHETDQTFAFAMADWDRDGTPDLVAIKKSNTGTHSTEVHVLSGASGFQQFVLQTGTALHETDQTFDFALTDWDGDGIPDLVAIKKSNTGTHSTEVHVLSGASGFQQFILQTGTALHETDQTFAFAMTDWDRDGKPDLVAIKKSNTGTHSTEVHVLSGASGFQQFLLQTGTALHETDQTFAFGLQDWDRDGVPDLVAVKQSNTGTSSTEVHVLPGAARFVRRNVWTLRSAPPWDPITEAYARAVAVMQTRPANDPTSWTFQAAIHATFAAAPAGVRWNECQHQSWFFLPWHRMYLYYFERIVRAAVASAGGPADFALPYWNYDQPFPNNTLPEPFRQATLPDGSANPLNLPPPIRNSAIMNEAALSPFVTSSSAAMGMLNFASPPNPPGFGGGRRAPAHFGGSTGGLEQTPHNDVHVQLSGPLNDPCQGGWMGDPRCAALDPIFWLHHANIDRLWNSWLALGGGRANPTDPAWLNQAFTFYDETGALVSLTGAQVVDSAAQLDYVYDDQQPSLAQMMAAADQMAGRSPERDTSEPPDMAAATDRPVTLTGAPTSVRLVTPPSTLALLARDDVAAGSRSVYLNVEDIEASQNPGVVYGVFVNMPANTPEAARGRFHVGNIALFGVEVMNDPDRTHDAVPGFRHTFDITRVVSEQSKAGQWDPAAVIVTFEPLVPIPPAGRAADLADSVNELLTAAAARPVRVGRVSLFVGP